jgi:hypothetical protein
MKLLTVIPCCKNDAARAEQLIDMIFQLEDRQAKGHCLLVCSPDVHPEMRAKLKISASLAFESVELFDQIEIITLTKHEQCIEMLRQTAKHIFNNYTWPWLWLEPDCLPLVPGWLDKLASTYENQPRRYMGLKMQSSGITFLSRLAIYPYNALVDIEQAVAVGTPLDQITVNKSLNCRMFQWLAVNELSDSEKVRPDAVLLHHDKRGVLLDWVINKAAPKPVETIAVKPRGRPPKFQTELATT